MKKSPWRPSLSLPREVGGGSRLLDYKVEKEGTERKRMECSGIPYIPYIWVS